jgi:hypothetical protein
MEANPNTSFIKLCLKRNRAAGKGGGIAFILDGQVLAQVIWLEDSWGSSKLQKICFHSGTSYVQLGFTIYVGHSLRNAGAYILAW